MSVNQSFLLEVGHVLSALTKNSDSVKSELVEWQILLEKSEFKDQSWTSNLRPGELNLGNKDSS